MILKCFGDYKNPTRKPPHCGNIDKRLCKNNTVGSLVSPVQPNTIPSQDRPSKSSNSASMGMLALHTGSTTLRGSSGSYFLRPSWAKHHGAGPWRSLGLRYWPLVTSVPTSSWEKQRIRTMPPPYRCCLSVCETTCWPSFLVSAGHGDNIPCSLLLWAEAGSW